MDFNKLLIRERLRFFQACHKHIERSFSANTPPMKLNSKYFHWQSMIAGWPIPVLNESHLSDEYDEYMIINVTGNPNSAGGIYFLIP